MLRGPVLVGVAMAVCMAAVGCPVSGQGAPSGVRWAVVGATIEASGRLIAVPPTYRVVHVAEAGLQLYVTAYTDSTMTNGRHLYHAEVWMFGPPGAENAADGFGSRRTLFALDTHDGESKRLPTRTVPCQSACAVYVDGWESGHTLLFRSDGQPIDVSWPRQKGDEPCCVDFVTPLAWLEDYAASYQSTLVCRMNYHGDDAPYLVTYHLQSGKIEAMPLGDGMKRFGPELLAAIERQTE